MKKQIYHTVSNICKGFCTSKPCFNGGRCFEDQVKFICICPAGYTGDQCTGKYTWFILSLNENKITLLTNRLWCCQKPTRITPPFWLTGMPFSNLFPHLVHKKYLVNCIGVFCLLSVPSMHDHNCLSFRFILEDICIYSLKHFGVFWIK
jgi:hypothetical protein